MLVMITLRSAISVSNDPIPIWFVITKRVVRIVWLAGLKNKSGMSVVFTWF